MWETKAGVEGLSGRIVALLYIYFDLFRMVLQLLHLCLPFTVLNQNKPLAVRNFERIEIEPGPAGVGQRRQAIQMGKGRDHLVNAAFKGGYALSIM